MSESKNILDKAFAFAKKAHKGQLYGDRDFIYHPLQTFRILEIITDDENLLTAALLHDTIEDTKTTYKKLVKEFNQDVADLVQEVTKSGSNTFPHLKTARGILLKFADRTANLSNIRAWDEKKTQWYLNQSKFWKSE